MKTAIPLHAASTQQRNSTTPIHLTPRQVEVLYLLCEGLPNKLICRQLNIASGTVKVHIGVILRELGVSSRLQAVVAAQRCGLLADTGTTPASTGPALGTVGRVMVVESAPATATA